jgi:hypothetical protein
MAAAVFADPELRDRFQLMAKDGEARPFVPDDFAWLSPDAKPPTELSRFKALAQKLFGVAKADLHRA